MISIPRATLESTQQSSVPSACIVGVGNAGVAFVDSLTLAGAADHARLIAVNTDSVSLGSSVVGEKVLIGQATTRGLGSGGDPELGAQAAEEAEAMLTAMLDGCGVVVLCGGLGGGTGSGAIPVIAEIARRTDAVVIALVTLPFSFEGKRRMRQAEDSLHDISQCTNAVLTLENDGMSALAEPMSGVNETFSASDQTLADSLSSLLRLVSGTGPMRVSLADILRIFQPGMGVARFGTAAAKGGNRANQVVERVLKSPLLRTNSLGECGHVIFHIEASSALQFVEVETAVRALAAVTGPESQIHLALTTNEDLADAMVVSVFGCGQASRAAGNDGGQQAAQEEIDQPPPQRVQTPRTSTAKKVQDTVEVNSSDSAPADELFNTAPYTLSKDANGRRTAKPKQETLSLDPVARGRFEKSEPTIVGGEDLDVPTFLRHKIKLR